MNFKEELSRVFDDNLHTKQWHNIVDYSLFGLILLSTLQVFLSTYDVIVEKYGLWLNIIDYFTTIIFTIEVTLRIWAADLIDEKYKGFWGRIRYCFSFYGFIDIISTYPFYLHFFMPIPYAALKAFRVARLLRIFRYMKAFSVLSRAISSKKQEMVVSLQFLAIITVILSFVLFFVENKVQPDVYDNGWTSVVWAFAQYIGDPGGFADTPPITTCGRIIACIIGVLGIAIFAVPAGLIGSAFTEVMEEDEREENLRNNIERIRHSFKFEKDQHYTNLYHVPRYQPLNMVLTRKFMPEAQIIETIGLSEGFHLYNLAETMNKEEKPQDKVVIVNCYRNTSYGACIDRGSNVTIVSTSGFTEPTSSWLAFHIAKLGGFNYVAKEVEVDADNPVSYYNVPDENACKNFKLFMEDLNRLCQRPNSWVIPILSAIGPRSRPTQLHFCFNTNKHDTSYSDPKAHIKDYATFDAMYQAMEKNMSKYNYSLDKNEYYAISKANVERFIKADNVFTLRVECFVYIYNSNFLEVIKTMADTFHQVFEPEREIQLPPEMLTRQIGHDFGMNDYVD